MSIQEPFDPVQGHFLAAVENPQRARELISAHFEFADGTPANPTTAIVPICTRLSGSIQIRGTGFFVAPHTLATAKHVLFNDDALVAPLFVYQIAVGRCWEREVSLACCHLGADVAVLMLDHRRASMIPPVALPITTRSPARGEMVRTFAYPRSEVLAEPGLQSVFLAPDLQAGFIEDHLPGGRPGRGLGPCYQTSMFLGHKASGGPVFDQSGRVFAVNSTGFEILAGEQNISFVSSIGPLLDCAVRTAVIDGVTRKEITIRELAKLGYVSLG